MTSPFDAIGGLARSVRREQRGVSKGPELMRIADLPRRQWDEEETSIAQDMVTELLRTPGGGMRLLPIQAQALVEVHDVGGGLFPIAVGGGKTLVSLLSPVLLGSARPVLLIPPDLFEKTKVDIEEMGEHWRLHPHLAIVKHSAVSQTNAVELLEQLNPDLIIIDECQGFSRHDTSRTKRLRRYMTRNPSTRMVAMSGTIAQRSLKDYAHLAEWCLRESSPLPRPSKGWSEVSDWSRAIDRKIKESERLDPGALRVFVGGGEDVHDGFRRRCQDTPGWIASGEKELGTALVFRRVDAKPDEETWKLISKVRNVWERPDGDPIFEAVEQWRILRQLAQGFYYRWKEKPPTEWVDARRDWAVYVRWFLQNNRRAIDSEGALIDAIEDGSATRPGAYDAWVAVKYDYQPETEYVPTGDFLRKRVASWVEKNGGIVWVDAIEFGEHLAHDLDVPYFGAGDDGILKYRGPCIASIQAHHKGKNLQRQWSRNLVLAPPSSGRTWEQLIGRTHRRGQPRDTVFVDVLQTTGELRKAVIDARADARWLEGHLGNPQRLCYGSWAF